MFRQMRTSLEIRPISLPWKINFTTVKISISTLSIPYLANMFTRAHVSTFQLAGINLHFLVRQSSSVRTRPGFGEEKSQMSNIATNFRPPINCSSFSKETHAPTRVCMRMLEQSPGFPFIPETDLRTAPPPLRGETFSKRFVKYVSRNGETKGRKTWE